MEALKLPALRTYYECECYRQGDLVWEDAFYNLVTLAGRTKLLDAVFRSGIGANAWYVGLVDSASFASYNAVNTMGDHGDQTAVSALSSVGTLATATCAGHGLVDGETVLITGATPSGYNGSFVATVVSSSVFTYTVAAGLASATGSITATRGWVEFTTYTGSNRASYTPDAASDQTITNDTLRASFIMNDAGVVKGAFLTNNAPIGGATGTLYGEGSFVVNRSVVSGDILTIKVTLLD